MTASNRTAKLLALVDLVSKATNVIVEEWDKEDATSPIQAHDEGSTLPSLAFYNAQRTILAACGTFVEIVHTPQIRLLEVATEYLESRALHVAVEHSVADHLAKADQTIGMSVLELSKITGIHYWKLGRIMRTLCSSQIFAEVREGRFANNSISQSLVNNGPLRAYILSHARENFKSAERLPAYLADPEKGRSTSPACTPFQLAFNTDVSLFDWFEEGLVEPDGSLVPRPELENFGLSMVGLGRVLGKSLCYDFPWGTLGSATVVDVGGGVGGLCIDLSALYHELKFIVQDRAPVMEQAAAIWERERPGALESGRVRLVPHNFFEDNPVKGADIYVLRIVLHDWADDACVKILSALRPALSTTSRVLIADQVMNTTVGCPDLPSAPYPLPANYGAATRFAHEHDLDMMTIINGAERTPSEFRSLAQQAGLEVIRFWECRGVTSITEMRLAEVKQ